MDKRRRLAGLAQHLYVRHCQMMVQAFEQANSDLKPEVNKKPGRSRV